MLADLNTLKLADCDSSNNVRGFVRISRRVLQRCLRDAATNQQKRIFCQNSGACGSTYIVGLLNENGIARCFHEKAPDLNSIGVQHYEAPTTNSRLVWLLRYTRHNAFFEANNRLFSMTRELSVAFPNALFMHLHRDGTQCVRSAMSKPNVEEYLRTNIRFQGTLAGKKSDPPFVRLCQYWANMNRRIAEDMKSLAKSKGTSPLPIQFEDLVKGRVQPLEDALGFSLEKKTCQPVNVGRVRTAGKFAKYADWSEEQKVAFETICGPVMAMLGR